MRQTFVRRSPDGKRLRYFRVSKILDEWQLVWGWVPAPTSTEAAFVADAVMFSGRTVLERVTRSKPEGQEALDKWRRRQDREGYAGEVGYDW